MDVSTGVRTAGTTLVLPPSKRQTLTLPTGKRPKLTLRGTPAAPAPAVVAAAAPAPAVVAAAAPAPAVVAAAAPAPAVVAAAAPAPAVVAAAAPAPDRHALWRDVALLSWRPVAVIKGRFRGHASFRVKAIGLDIHTVGVSVHPEGKPDFNLPGRPVLDADGKRVPRHDGHGFAYSTVLDLEPRLFGEFRKAALKALLDVHPEILSAEPGQSEDADYPSHV
jgi:hypothetical protein